MEEAVKQTLEGKSPSLDDFTSKLFQYRWHFIKTNVWNVVEESRKKLGIHPSFNATILTLIPKEGRSIHPKYLHPIPLCNVIFKIITKVLSSYLKPLLPLLNIKEKTGYMEG